MPGDGFVVLYVKKIYKKDYFFSKVYGTIEMYGTSAVHFKDRKGISRAWNGISFWTISCH